MILDRKTFLKRLGAGAVGLTIAGAWESEAASPRQQPALPSFDSARAEEFWAAVRRMYPLKDDPIYLNAGGLGPTSQPVLDRVFSTTRKLQEHCETGHALLEPARATVAHFLGAAPEELCFVRNATEGNSIIATGLRLRAGDEVIFETHAHPGGSFPWLNQAKERGIVVRLFEPDPNSAEANLKRIQECTTPKTRVIQVSHITCTTGLVLPVAEIASYARSRGIWFHIDGAQSVGMIPIDVKAIGCDSFAFSGHKWLGGPQETGGLYLRHDRLGDVALSGVGAYSGEIHQLPDSIAYASAALRHEYGTRNAALTEGLAEAVKLQEDIGRARIANRGRELAERVREGIRGLTAVEVLSPERDDLRASILTLRHTRAEAGKFFGYLLSEHRLRCRPVTEQGLQAVRISTHIFNMAADIERVVAAIRSAAQIL